MRECDLLACAQPQLPPLRATSSDTRLAVKVVVTSKLLCSAARTDERGSDRRTGSLYSTLRARSVPFRAPGLAQAPQLGPEGLLAAWLPFLPLAQPAGTCLAALLPQPGFPDRSAGRPVLSQPPPQAVTTSTLTRTVSSFKAL